MNKPTRVIKTEELWTEVFMRACMTKYGRRKLHGNPYQGKISQCLVFLVEV